ncbi:MAG TPA: glycosyltransferase family 1 protein [Desulfobulbaceae bacterium]|nr:glycosyltransferase family 1 protein [Desulfobulbaceae bacterium]
MRITQILYSGLGGHGSVAFSLLDADEKTQWDPFMGFLGIEPLSEDYVQKCHEKKIAFRYFSAVSGKPWMTWLAIYQWLEEVRPEAVILHSPTALLPCLWYTRRFTVPLVVVEHEPNALKRSVDWGVSRLVQLFADSVVLLTPDYQKEMKQRLGSFFQFRKNHVIPNGIDTQLFCPSAYSFDSNLNKKRVIRMGMAARFTETKRQDVLVEMMVELNKKMPEVEWKLSLAGQGVNWNTIAELIRDKELQSCIELPGMLDPQALSAWLQSLDIYLHASEGETLSTSLLQAMATGLPIVASDVPGIRNLVGGDNACGLLVSSQSPQEFADSVLKLFKDDALRDTIGKQGHDMVLSKYSQEKMFNAYDRLLQKHV